MSAVHMPANSKILDAIAHCHDAEALRTWIKNAQKKEDVQVSDAAFRRLIAILPQERPGSIEHDFWKTIHAFEHILTEERGKTTRLARTRQKVTRVGVLQTLSDWALSKQTTNGFDMLLDRAMPELTGEAIVLRHSSLFAADIVAAASRRLEESGVEISKLPSTEG
jgi:hypothetical protein